MATTRPFSYNPEQATITGTTNVGTLCIGVSDLDYATSPGGSKCTGGEPTVFMGNKPDNKPDYKQDIVNFIKSIEEKLGKEDTKRIFIDIINKL